MMQGDSFYLPIGLTDEKSETITPAMLDDLEVVVGGIRKTLKSGNIAWDDERKLFLAELTQRDTFALRGEEQVIARPKFIGGEVVGVNLVVGNVVVYKTSFDNGFSRIHIFSGDFDTFFVG